MLSCRLLPDSGHPEGPRTDGQADSVLNCKSPGEMQQVQCSFSPRGKASRKIISYGCITEDGRSQFIHAAKSKQS